ncbi:restriction endonuclease subunit S [Streptomyces sp. NPDC006645]|uniref:restriction endonuclease subunit S n=1 Tax=unclassified Streptomyces TaxID=2593676 RepID=UPI0033AC7256
MAVKTGNVNPANYPDEIFDLYSIPAFDSGKSELTVGNRIGSPKQVVQPGDVLLAKIVPHIRRCWIVGKNRGKRIIASGEWIVFRPAGDIDANYLRHVLVGDSFHAQFMNTVAGVGGSLMRARPVFVAQIKIPVPPLAEQERIAQVLDHVNALRARRRQAISLLDVLTQSIFVEMFGDPVRNPKGWPMKTIGDLIESASYGTSEKASEEGDIPVLRMGNITSSGQIDLSDLKFMDRPTVSVKYLIRRGDVLFNRTNSADLVGKTAIYRGSDELAYAGYLIRMRVNKENDPEYLAAFLNTPYAKRVLRGMCKSIVGMANINARELQNINVAEPPLNLQVDYAKRVEVIESLREIQRRHLVELDTLFASLQNRAFRGDLWLDEAVPAA